MTIEESLGLKLGAIIRVNLGGPLDGMRFIANGPLVFTHGDTGEVVGDSMFPTVTNRGIQSMRKYVVRFAGLGGLRTILSPEEIQRPFELVKQGDREAPDVPRPLG